MNGELTFQKIYKEEVEHDMRYGKERNAELELHQNEKNKQAREARGRRLSPQTSKELMWCVWLVMETA